MQTLRTSNYEAVPCSHCQSLADSYDCSGEFSLCHWIHVYKLVEEADAFDVDEELACFIETERVEKKTVSEVKPSATYQHFAGNVV